MSNVLEKILIFGLTGAVALLTQAHNDKQIKKALDKSVEKANGTEETEE